MFTLPDLPYAFDALEPILSADTLHTHHDKHHAAYVKKSNELAQKAGLSESPLETVILEAKKRNDSGLFNNAAQAWNHAFLWRSMTPNRAEPSGDLNAAIKAAFGDLNNLGEAFVKEGVGHFGSGWVWLVSDKAGDLNVIATHDADDTLTHAGIKPLLVCDLWEHAYYLDYKNDREGFLKRWFAELADWSFAGEQFEARQDSAAGFRYPTLVAA